MNLVPSNPSASAHARFDKGTPMRNFAPTLHKPGSELKIEVMAKRRRKKLPLFHPLDYAEPRTNTITITPTGADRAAMQQKLSSDPHRHRPGARVGYFREPT